MLIFFVVGLVIFSLILLLFFIKKYTNEHAKNLIKEESIFFNILKVDHIELILISFVFSALVISMLLINEKKFAFGFSIFTSIIIAAFIAYIVREYKINKVKENILKQMPYALDILRLNLEGGRNLSQSISFVAKTVDFPVSLVFKKIAIEEQMGISLTDTLSDLCKKYPKNEILFFAIILNNSYINASLSIESFAFLSKTIRNQQVLNRKIKKNMSQMKGDAIVGSIFIIGSFLYGYQSFIEVYDLPYGSEIFYSAISLGVISIGLFLYITKVK